MKGLPVSPEALGLAPPHNRLPPPTPPQRPSQGVLSCYWGSLTWAGRLQSFTAGGTCIEHLSLPLPGPPHPHLQHKS